MTSDPRRPDDRALVEATRRTLTPDPVALRARYEALVEAQHHAATEAWRAPRAVALALPFFVLNASLPGLPGGAALTGVTVAASWACFGPHLLVYLLATALWRRDPGARGYAVLNALDSLGWLVAAGVLIGLSGTATSVYWIHVGLMILVGFPNIPSHRRIFAGTVGASVVATACLAVSGPPGSALYAAMVGATLSGFQAISQRIAPRAVWAQARAELVSETATELVLAAQRKRIQRDLHDNLGAELAALLWTARDLDDGDTDAVRPLVDGVVRAMNELRAMLRDVVPEPMTVPVLRHELERMAARMATPDVAIEVDVRAHDERASDVGGTLAVTVLRIAQGSVHNALAHAAPHHVRVEVDVAPDAIVLAVVDDGGPGAVLEPGVGMRGVRDRVADVGGTVAWSSSETGVRVDARLPRTAT